MTLNCFEHKFYFLCIKLECQKTTNFLDTTSDDKIYQDLLLKNGLKFMEEIKMSIKKLELKHQC